MDDVDAFKGRTDGSMLIRYIARQDRPHALKGSSLERQQASPIRCSSFCKDGKQRVLTTGSLYLSLPVDNRLDDIVAGFRRASATNVERG